MRHKFRWRSAIKHFVILSPLPSKTVIGEYRGRGAGSGWPLTTNMSTNTATNITPNTVTNIAAMLVIMFTLFGNIQPAAASQRAETLLLTGMITSINSQSFIVPKPGDAWRYQIQWMLAEGEIVEPGQAVIIFDKSQIANQIEQLEASLLRVTAEEQSQSIDFRSSVLQSRFDLRQKQLEVEKSQLDADVPTHFLAAKDYAENQFSLLKARSELVKAEQMLKEVLDRQASTNAKLAIDRNKAQLELKQALSGIEQLTLRASIMGPVIYQLNRRSDKKFAVGDMVQLGRQVITVPAMDALEVIAWVNEVDADKLSTGSSVSLRLDSQSAFVFAGTIKDISRQAQQQLAWGSSNWFKVKISFEHDDRVTLVPGMSVLVQSQVQSQLALKSVVSETAAQPAATEGAER